MIPISVAMPLCDPLLQNEQNLWLVSKQQNMAKVMV